uniref:Uncharacterized protein n=1 Tax=Timema genevievae TaxID=629358 RepID=A0A7R9PS58_TIMGE|nr:unnamed protein product [Timema genevievae]
MNINTTNNGGRYLNTEQDLKQILNTAEDGEIKVESRSGELGVVFPEWFSTLPPHKSRVTCYTCVNVSDNLVCNKFAIDRPCPLDKDFCHTLHVMDSRGQSVVVNKKCANSSECSPQRVGCVSIDTQKFRRLENKAVKHMCTTGCIGARRTTLHTSTSWSTAEEQTIINIKQHTSPSRNGNTF